MKENENVEFKREVTDELKKEIVSFANSYGGTIYIGIEDDGKVIGVPDIDGSMLKITSMIRDAIHPDITMFVRVRSDKMKNHDVIMIDVSEGTNKPYYIAKNGLKPSGVYVRQGSASAQASDEQIRQMIKQTDGDTYEDEISVLQELTFSKMEDVFRQHNMKLANEQMVTLGLRKQNKLWTNLGLLLSDQCPFSVKTAVFAGEDQTEFKDRKEFNGSLLKQLEDSYEFIQLNNPTAASFLGLYRKDEKSYPDDALREALLNSIIHRDYSYSASTLISIYSDRIEFVSIGGLLPGIHKEDIMLGISVCRNKKLANIFYRLDLIEAYGTGIQKIRNAYGSSDSKPEILIAPNSFKIILPQMVCDDALHLAEENSSEQRTVLNYIDSKGTITREIAEKVLQVSPSTAGRILRDMCDSSLIVKVGRGKGTRYSKNISQN